MINKINNLFRFKKSSKNTKMIFLKGTTLIEVIMASALGTIILSSILVLHMLVRENFIIGSTALEIHSGARTAIDRVSRDIRRANRLVATRTFGGTAYTTNNRTIILEIPSIDSNGDIIQGQYDYIAYRSRLGILEKAVEATAPSTSVVFNGTTQTITPNLKNFRLSSGGTGLTGMANVTILDNIDILIETEKTPLLSKTVTESLNSNVKIRNK